MLGGGSGLLLLLRCGIVLGCGCLLLLLLHCCMLLLHGALLHGALLSRVLQLCGVLLLREPLLLRRRLHGRLLRWVREAWVRCPRKPRHHVLGWVRFRLLHLGLGLGLLVKAHSEALRRGLQHLLLVEHGLACRLSVRHVNLPQRVLLKQVHLVAHAAVRQRHEAVAALHCGRRLRSCPPGVVFGVVDAHEVLLALGRDLRHPTAGLVHKHVGKPQRRLRLGPARHPRASPSCWATRPAVG